MKRKKQITESKDMILNGLLMLTKTKVYKQISMTDIADAAKVTRVTLYRHFKNKEDIMLYGFEKNLDSFANEVRTKDDLTLYDLLLFRYKVTKSSPYTAILVENNYLKKILNLAKEKTFDKLDLYGRIELDDYVSEFMRAGSEAMVEKWVLDGMVISCEDMAKKSVDILYYLIQFGKKHK